MESLFYGLTRRDVCEIDYQLAIKNDISNPFGTAGIAGKDWLKRFMQRHKNRLSIRRPTGTSNARVSGFNKEQVAKFFDNLHGLFKRYHFSADSVFNVDETGRSVIQSKIPQVVGHKGKRQIGVLTAVGRGSLLCLYFQEPT